MNVKGTAQTEYASLSGKIHTLVIDKTLSISGACADAKATGDRMDVVDELAAEVAETISKIDLATPEAVNAHVTNTNNPHAVTAAQAGAVKKTGDTMTGHLIISTPAYTQVMLDNTGAGSRVKMQNGGHYFFVGVQDASTDSNQRQLMIRDKTNKDSVVEALQLADVINGTTTYYNIWGAHNKPDVAQIEVGSYVGTGTRGEDVVLTFGIAPKLVLIWESGASTSKLYMVRKGDTTWSTVASANSVVDQNCSLSDNVLTLYANGSGVPDMNESGITFNYAAIG